MVLNWINLSLWLGGVLIVASIISFLWHYRKEKNNTKLQQAQFGMQQNPQQFQNIPQQTQGIHQNQLNPFPYGTNEYWKIENSRINQQIQNPALNQNILQSNQQDEVLRQLKIKNDMMEHELNILKTKQTPYTIISSPAMVPAVQEQIQEKKQIINEELKIEKKNWATVEINILPQPLTDFESVEVIKQDLENELKSTLKTLKKTMKLKNIDIDINYEIKGD